MPIKAGVHVFTSPFQLPFHVRGRPSPIFQVSILERKVKGQREGKRLEVGRKSFYFQCLESVFPLTFSRGSRPRRSRRCPRPGKGSEGGSKLKKGRKTTPQTTYRPSSKEDTRYLVLLGFPPRFQRRRSRRRPTSGKPRPPHPPTPQRPQGEKHPPGVGNVKRRPPSDSAGRAGRGDRRFHADGPSVLPLGGAAVLAFSNDLRAITRERKGVEQSKPRDCVRLAQTYAAMSSPRRYDAFFF